jgi:predicted nucleic acid-binding protein
LRDLTNSVVLNTSSLWSFIVTHTFDLLRKFYSPIIVPLSVAVEIKKEFSIPKGIEVRTLNGAQQTYADSMGLGPGENEAMVLAIDMQISLIMDDGPAQEVAQQYGIDVFGSLEFVKAAFESCAIEREEYDRSVDAFQEEKRAHLGLISWARKATKPA